MNPDDRKLVRRLKRRDEDAFTELVKTYQHKVFNVIYRILGSKAEAEEVSQEVFIAIFKYIDSFRGEAKLSTWIYRIAINHARNRVKYLSRRSQRAHQDIDDGPETANEDAPLSAYIASPHEEIVGTELEDIIRDGLKTLNEIHRTIVILRDIEGLSYVEISKIVELPEGTVKSRLFRARVALKEYVESRYTEKVV